MEKDHLEVILESIDSKFQLVLEGHAALQSEMKSMRGDFNERLEHLDFKIDSVNANLSKRISDLDLKIDTVNANLSNRIDELDAKIGEVNTDLGARIDAVATDLKAHRADTEAHAPVYRVKEN